MGGSTHCGSACGSGPGKGRAGPGPRRRRGATAAGPGTIPAETGSGAGTGPRRGSGAAAVPGRGPSRADALPPRACRGPGPRGWPRPGPARAGRRARAPRGGSGATANPCAWHPEALLDPHPHSVGAEVHAVGGFVREQDPGGRLAGGPEHDQDAAPLARAEGPPGRHRVRAFAGHEAPGRPAGSGRRLEGRVPVVAQVGMPALAADGGLQAGAPQAPVAEDAHGHVRRHGGAQPAGRATRSGIQGPGWPPGFRRQAPGMTRPRWTTLTTRATRASPLAVGSMASVRSGPCHQAGTQRRSGAKQASTSRWTRQGAARSAPSQGHSRRY